jgi:hypothetical protein
MFSLLFFFPFSLLPQVCSFASFQVYIEAGALPALLNQLKALFTMSFQELGFLGGVVYFFLSLACPLAGTSLLFLSFFSLFLCSLIPLLCDL